MHMAVRWLIVYDPSIVDCYAYTDCSQLDDFVGVVRQHELLLDAGGLVAIHSFIAALDCHPRVGGHDNAARDVNGDHERHA